MKSLTDYLKCIYEAEKNKYMLQQMLLNEVEKLNNISWKIDKIRVEQNYEVALEKVPETEGKPEIISDFILIFFAYAIKYAAIWFGVGFFLVIPYAHNMSNQEYKDFGNSVLIILAIVLVVVAIVQTTEKLRLEKEKYDSSITHRENVIQRNKENVENDKRKKINNEKIISKLQLQQLTCRENQQAIKEKIILIDNTLKEYYELNIIFEKYHTFEAICKIYEYMSSGRCISLHGPSGAYDTYEKEKRTDLIIDKMDKMIIKLDEIKTTNIMLYHAMQGVSSSLEGVYSKVEEQADTMKELGTGFGKGIGVLEKNIAANNLLLQVTNQNVQQIKELEKYQTFAMKQQRLKDGYWQ